MNLISSSCPTLSADYPNLPSQEYPMDYDMFKRMDNDVGQGKQKLLEPLFHYLDSLVFGKMYSVQ